ncbi:two component transcriptional regulator, winged helix family [Chitinophaga rupis]|uniref:Two component transcriptional regulator, winged helix family n=1 Tax=Chitinophaga rupis TaxID=573321 RepID=A0A1H7LYS1_9BACT|nr:response regulator transcription factor [Chitinophaga rupis]SEL04150.1 two component transcriptional regulator, winged helix family [Chitinophaga rupis]
MKILLVEDEPNVVSLIKRGLADNGYEISVAMDGWSGLQMTNDHDFDLIILDIMLPGINGVEICRSIRKQNEQVPIMMLTALGTTENIVTGLDSGADDYLVKPFKLAELSARVRTLTRRSKNTQAPGSLLQIADLELDTVSKTVRRNNKPLNLTATEYRLLEFLLKNQRRVLSRIEILEHVWDIDFNLGTNVVDVYVNYLRKKIDKAGSSKLIHTVVGMGYVMREQHENTE